MNSRKINIEKQRGNHLTVQFLNLRLHKLLKDTVLESSPTTRINNLIDFVSSATMCTNRDPVTHENSYPAIDSLWSITSLLPVSLFFSISPARTQKLLLKQSSRAIKFNFHSQTNRQFDFNAVDRTEKGEFHPSEKKSVG